MDIMELGAIGELVGGVAVIASLLFVGLQIRGNTRASAAANQNAWVADYNSMLLAIRGDPEWMKVFRKGIVDFNGLSKNDRARVHLFLAAHILNAQNVFAACRRGEFDAETAKGFLSFCGVLIKTPGIAQWWKFQSPMLITAFVNDLERRARDEELPPLQEVLPWYALESGEVGEA